MNEINHRLQHYYKMVIVRNPLTRLLSAYRNKLEPPLNVTSISSFPNSIKRDILQMYRKQDLKDALKSPTLSKINPSFGEFLHYMTEYPLNAYNEHFVPVLNLCHPCAVRYNFYANFKIINYDIHAVMELLGIPSSYYPTRLAHPRHSTDEYLARYYGKVSCKELENLLGVFQDVLEFYFTLYPEEKESHDHFCKKS